MIDPSNIGAEAEKRVNENINFRIFLKNHADYDELDRYFSALHNEVFSNYDCCKCTNCCRKYDVSVEDDEVGAIADSLGLVKEGFIEKYLVQSSGGYEIKSPCLFLKENGECEIQHCKPAECRDFPYTDKPGRMESLLSIISFAEECPAVFEMLEKLKVIYEFKR